MEHSFSTSVAKQYGILPAVLLNNIFFWIEKNKANGQNYYDGYFWTFNTKKAMTKLFEYATERQIDYALQKLIANGILITGNYNNRGGDRTLWYAITNKGYTILQNCEMETTKLLVGNNKIVGALPYNKTKDINTYNKSKKESFDKIIEDYLNNSSIFEKDRVRDLLKEWLKVRKAKRSAMTDRAIQLNLNKLDNYAFQSGMSVENYLEEIICRGWQAFYVINNGKNKNTPSDLSQEKELYEFFKGE